MPRSSRPGPQRSHSRRRPESGGRPRSSGPAGSGASRPRPTPREDVREQPKCWRCQPGVRRVGRDQTAEVAQPGARRAARRRRRASDVAIRVTVERGARRGNLDAAEPQRASPARTGCCPGRSRRAAPVVGQLARRPGTRSAGTVTLRFAGSPGIDMDRDATGLQQAASSVKSVGRSAEPRSRPPAAGAGASPGRLGGGQLGRVQRSRRHARRDPLDGLHDRHDRDGRAIAGGGRRSPPTSSGATAGRAAVMHEHDPLAARRRGASRAAKPARTESCRRSPPATTSHAGRQPAPRRPRRRGPARPRPPRHPRPGPRRARRGSRRGAVARRGGRCLSRPPCAGRPRRPRRRVGRTAGSVTPVRSNRAAAGRRSSGRRRSGARG